MAQMTADFPAPVTASLGAVAAAAAADATAKVAAQHVVDNGTYAPLTTTPSSGNGASTTLMQILDAGSSSAAIQVLGDSTGNDTTEWPYLLTQWLATRYPTYTVRHRLWADGTQDYAVPTVIQTGAAGARYVRFAAGAGFVYYPSDAVNTITGDIDIRINCSLDAVIPAAAQCVFSKFDTTGTRAWRLTVNPTTGFLAFNWSTDGGAGLPTVTSTAAPGWTNGTALWLRVTLVVATGQAAFYTSPDGITWTTLGTNPGAVGATNIFAAATPVLIGARSGGADPMVGKVYEVDVRAGVAGYSTVPRMVDAYSTSATGTVSFVGAPVLDMINGSMPGASIAGYLNASAARLNAMTPRYGQSLTIINDSHNESGYNGPQWTAQLDTLLAAVRLRLPQCGFVAIGQNPQVGAAFTREHAARCAQVLAWARNNNGVGSVNIYKAFTDYATAQGVTVASLLVDTLHPTTAAQAAIYAPAVESALLRGV